MSSKFSNPGERNGQSKMTHKKVKQLKTLSKKMTQVELAEKFGISQGQVSKILRGVQWKSPA